MAEWVLYTGSIEQETQLRAAEGGYLLWIKNGTLHGKILDKIHYDFAFAEYGDRIYQYLMVETHPLQEIIFKQTLTQQPVYIRHLDGAIEVTDKPYWYTPGAEYRLEPFDNDDGEDM